MSGVGAVTVVPRLKLGICGSLDHSCGAFFQRLGDSVNYGANEGRKEREDEEGKSLANSLDKRFEAGNLGDGGVDSSNDFVSELCEMVRDRQLEEV